MNDKYVLDIEWDEGIDLPSLVGPFATRAEADDWYRLNVPNGTGLTRALSYPYSVNRRATR